MRVLLVSRIYSLRCLTAPLNQRQLRPLDASRERLYLPLSFSDTDFRRIARLLERHPETGLIVRDEPWKGMKQRDLDFLRYFPFVRRLWIDVPGIEALDGLRHVGTRLKELHIEPTLSRRLSLRVLEDFPNLHTLHISSHSKDIDSISGLRRLKELDLWSVALPDLAIIKNHHCLNSLSLTLGNSKDLHVLPHLANLRSLALRQVSGLSDLEPIGECVALRSIWLQNLAHVNTIPSLKQLVSLRKVNLSGLKSLKSLASIARAPALQELKVTNMRHLAVAQFRIFLKHPTLRDVHVGLGSLRKNAEVQLLLGINPSTGRRNPT